MQSKQKNKVNHKIIFLKILIHLCAFTPLLRLYLLAFFDELGADPVESVIHFTGIGAFNLLLITLLVSPLAKKFKISWLMKVRRLLGLYAFSYAFFHVLNFLAFDLQFDFSLSFSEIIKRPYITIGMIAFVLLITMAVTSINKIKKQMGKKWQSLHKANYFIIVLVAIHFYWSVKSEIMMPIIYFLLSLYLLSLRHGKIKKWFFR